MKKSFLVITAAIIIVFFAVMFTIKDRADEGSSTFIWRFEEAKTTNLDGLPQTNLYLTVQSDSRRSERLIDTVDGGCSELEGEKHEGDISDTGSVQCYSAGLGQEYRIMQGENAYVIERKLFEEALPDMAPPNYEWEIIEEIPAP